MERFMVKQGSETAHCCFEWSIVDTNTDQTICEGFDNTYSLLICEKLNLWNDNLINKKPRTT